MSSRERKRSRLNDDSCDFILDVTPSIRRPLSSDKSAAPLVHIGTQKNEAGGGEGTVTLEDVERLWNSSGAQEALRVAGLPSSLEETKRLCNLGRNVQELYSNVVQSNSNEAKVLYYYGMDLKMTQFTSSWFVYAWHRL